MLCSSYTDPGKVRDLNEDCFMAERLGDSIRLYTVCDGMGGASAGQTASSIACAVYRSAMIASLSNYVAEDNISALNAGICSQLIEYAISAANTAVFDLAGSESELSGMGTTLVSALIVNKTAYIANVGDSRAYSYKHGKLQQITKDHSYVQYLLDNNMITSDEAESHPHKNWITRSVGTSADITPDLFILDLKKAEVILLCSDGLTNMVSEAEISREIAKVLAKSSAIPFEDLATRLGEMANSNGGSDNITVLALHTRKKH